MALRVLLLPVLLLVSLSLTACEPVGPDEPPPPDDVEEEAAPESLETQTVTFGPSGGVLTFADGATLEVPPYSLDEQTEIDASRWRVPTAAGDIIEYRLEPSGVVFARPATLRLALPAGSVNSEGLAVGFSPTTDLDLKSLGRLSDAQRVTAQIVETGRAAVIEDSGVRTVAGTAITTSLLRDGRIEHVNDTLIEGSLLLVIRNQDGTAQEKSAAVEPSGIFRFDDVPSGLYELRARRRHPVGDHVSAFVVQTDASTLDLGGSTPLRSTAKRPTGESPLSVVLEAPEVSDTDFLTFVSAETNRFDYGFWIDPTAEGPLFQTRSTSVQPARLLDGREGDVLTVVRLKPTTSAAGFEYQPASDRAHLTSIIQADGAETPVAGKLEPYAFNRSLSTTIQVGEFMETLGVAGASDCSITTNQGAVFSTTVAADTGLIDSSHFDHQLLLFAVDLKSEVQSTGLMHYGSDRPFPDAEYFSLLLGGSQMHLLPGTSTGSFVPCLASDLTLTLKAAQAGPIAPRLSPPTRLRVNAQDADSDYLVVPPGTLVLEWDAPKVGTATSYRVRLYTYRADGDRTRYVDSIEVVTTERRLELSSELLLEAEAFSFMVDARENSVVAPFRLSTLGASAGVGSGLIHVQE